MVNPVCAIRTLAGYILLHAKLNKVLFIGLVLVEVPPFFLAVKDDVSVGTSRDAGSGASTTILIHENNSIGPSDNSLIRAGFEARCIVAVVTQDRNVDPLHVRIRSSLNI